MCENVMHLCSFKTMHFGGVFKKMIICTSKARYVGPYLFLTMQQDSSMTFMIQNTEVFDVHAVNVFETKETDWWM